MFCHITASWRGQPLTSHEVIVNLIGNTKTKTGLTIQAELDTGSYPPEFRSATKIWRKSVRRRRSSHGEWNYRISPSAELTNLFLRDALLSLEPGDRRIGHRPAASDPQR